MAEEFLGLPFEEEETTAEKGKLGKGEVPPPIYGQEVPSLFGEGKELLLYGKKTPEEEPFKDWETGYRAWKLRFRGGEPRLGSIGFSSGVWEPGEAGEVVSDWKEEGKEPFEETSKGLYSLKSLKEVKERYGGEDIYGAIIPYGKTFHGETGYRSEKAKVRSLFRGVISCYICSKPAKYYVRNDERFPMCERCLKRLERLVKTKGYREEDIESVLQRLAEIYEAEVEEAPE